MATYRLAILCAAFLSFGGASIFAGETLTFVSKKGRKFNAAELTKVEPSGIVVTTDVGIERVAFEDLPPELQKQFGYDPVVAAELKEKARETQSKRLRERLQNRSEVEKRLAEEMVAGFKEGFEMEFNKSIKLDWPVFMRKLKFAMEVLGSESEPETEYEKARYEYALKFQEALSKPYEFPSMEEHKRRMELHKKGLPAETDVPAYLLSETAFNEWKRIQAEKGDTKTGTGK
jgi:hypothetical protein